MHACVTRHTAVDEQDGDVARLRNLVVQAPEGFSAAARFHVQVDQEQIGPGSPVAFNQFRSAASRKYGHVSSPCKDVLHHTELAGIIIYHQNRGTEVVRTL
jgi:hypothetical protein